MFNIKALREEFAKLHGEATAVVETAAGESRELKPEEKEANEKRFSRISTIKQTLDEHARFAAMALSNATEGATPAVEGEGGQPEGTVQFAQDAPGRKDFERSQDRIIVGESKIDRGEFAKALNGWGATGQMDRKFATITSATSSGVLLPKSVGAPIVPVTGNVFRDALAIYKQQPVYTPGTGELPYPVFGANAGGEVAEDASSETENGVDFAESIDLNVKTYQSKSAWFSYRVLAGLDFDLLQYAMTALVDAKERGFEAATVAALIADTNVTQAVTTASTAGTTYGELVDLNRKLPKRFDRLKVIVLGQAAFSAAEKLVGDDGHPVLNIDPQNQGLMRFNGTPVLRSDNFDAFGASKTIGAVVSLVGFMLRDAAQQKLERYTQNANKPDQVGVNLVGYSGFGWAPSAVAKLKTPAS